MSLNLQKLETILAQKLNSVTSDEEILLYSKAIEKLKTGIVNVIDNLDNLMMLTDPTEGTLYFVETERRLYVKSFEYGWKLLGQDGTSTLWHWGWVDDGQEGNGTNYRLGNSLVPTLGGSGFTDWCDVAMSYWGVFALKTDGSLWRWGSFEIGENDYGVPKKIPNNYNDWCKIRGGCTHGLLQRRTGELFSYGYANWAGWLGTGYAYGYKRGLQRVCGDNSDFSKIKSAPYHTIGLRNDGTLWSWGLNREGALGISLGYRDPSFSFKEILPPSQASSNGYWCQVAISSEHALAIDRNGLLQAWGRNNCGQLGTNDTITTEVRRPVCTGLLTGWCGISAGEGFSSAVRTNGSLWAWGCGGIGRLGDGTVTNKSSPVSVVGGFTDWCQVSLGGSFAAAIRSNCTLWTWGFNGNNRLGDGTITNRSSPVSVVGGFTDWCHVSSGSANAVAVRTNGTLWAWGYNTNGQLGDGTTVGKCSPVSVVGGFTDWCQVSAGCCNMTAIRQNGTLWAWGIGTLGQLGDGTVTNKSSPVSVVGGFTDWCQVATGHAHSIAVKTNGSVWSWGCNSSGQLGDGTVINKSSPVMVMSSGQCQVRASGRNSALLTVSSPRLTIYTVGSNTFGQLGQTKDYFTAPQIVSGGFTDWCQFDVSGDQSAAIRTNGTLWGWGRNYRGSLGNGTGHNNNSSSPVSVIGGFTDWCDVSITYLSSKAIRKNGTIWTWGDPSWGNLGNNCSIELSSPATIVGGFNDWCLVKTGYRNSAAIRSNGTLWVWGANGGCILTDGTTSYRSSPVSVVGGFTDWCDISIGFLNFTGLKCDGTIWNWGCNWAGQLGDGTDTIKASPDIRIIGNIEQWKTIAAGPRHALAIDKNNVLWGWGANFSGSVGDGTNIQRSCPVSVVGGFTDWCRVALGEDLSTAIRTNGTLWAWGDNCSIFGSGRLGDGTAIDRSSPVSVVGGFTDWCQSTTGCTSTLAVRTNGTLWAWGGNNGGQLGDGTVIERLSPVSVIGGFTDWCQVSGKGRHTAAVRTNGSLWTWGQNGFGQLGDGTFVYRSSPVSVIGGFTDWVQASASSKFVVALRNNGTLWSWGRNDDGELGDGTSGIDRTSPVSVVGGFTDWCAITTGCGHAIGIRTNGTAWGWGYNYRPSIGDGTDIPKSSPVAVCGFQKWKTIDASDYFSVGVNREGRLFAWGCNEYGQAGNGFYGFDNLSVPTSVVPPEEYTYWCSVDSGNYHNIALRNDGTVWNWGYNDFGSLGDGTIENRSSPVSVPVPGIAKQVSAGGRYSSFAVTQDGLAWSWGGNKYARLGHRDMVDRSSPTCVVGTFGWCDWIDIDAGQNHSMGLRSDGTIWTWGINWAGNLGDGTDQYRSSPTKVLSTFGDDDWKQVAIGNFHSAALKNNGTIWTWGSAAPYSGRSDYIARSSPVIIDGGVTDWCFVDSSRQNSLALRSNGTLWIWGFNCAGSIGDGTDGFANRKPSPVQVAGGFTDWVCLSAGYQHHIGVRSNGTLWAWGWNGFGGLGDGTIINRSSPVSVVGGFTDWCAASSGYQNSLGLRSNGSLWSWGCNRCGEAGTGIAGINSSSPVSVIGGFTDWCQAEVTTSHAVAIKTNGTLWAWGRNNDGQIGDGTGIDRSSPVTVIGGFTDWCQLSAGYSYNAAVRQNGTIWIWGTNFGGTESIASALSSPVSIAGTQSWKSVSLQLGHALAIDSNNCIWGWGDNFNAELGIGNTVGYVSRPTGTLGTKSNWKAIAAGYYRSAGIGCNGTLWTWGCDAFGALGNGVCGIDRSSPVSVVGGFTDWCKAANKGFGNMTALRENGTLWSWGYNQRGQLGIGFFGGSAHRSSPVIVAGGFTDWCDVVNNVQHTIALRTNGTAWGWGRNWEGEVGIGLDYSSANFKGSPLQLCGNFNDWVKVAAGYSSNLGIRCNTK